MRWTIGNSEHQLDCTIHAVREVVTVMSLQTTGKAMTLACLHAHTGVMTGGE